MHAKTAVIVRDVRERGGEAVASYTHRFDRLWIDADTLQSRGIDLLEAGRTLYEPKVREALNFAADRIETYHAQQKPQDHSIHRRDRAGTRLALDPGGCGRALCARRAGELSKFRADERRSRQKRRA